MATITVEEAQARLLQLIDGLAPGEELVITHQSRPIAHLVGLAAGKPRPVPGRGKLVTLSEDDEHLEGFEDDLP